MIIFIDAMFDNRDLCNNYSPGVSVVKVKTFE